MALVGDPELLFLDEPTTGFDPSARRQAWEVIAGLRDLGKTVFLTTHYMDEAQRLADRVAIIAGGEIVARGTPEDLGDRDGQPATISYRARRRARSRCETDDAGRRPCNELTGRALARGRRARGPRGDAAEPRGRLPGADRADGRSAEHERPRPRLHQFRYDQKAFWRNPAVVFFTVLFPVVLL